jgi:hypothetical protein
MRSHHHRDSQTDHKTDIAYFTKGLNIILGVQRPVPGSLKAKELSMDLRPGVELRTGADCRSDCGEDNDDNQGVDHTIGKKRLAAAGISAFSRTHMLTLPLGLVFEIEMSSWWCATEDGQLARVTYWPL